MSLMDKLREAKENIKQKLTPSERTKYIAHDMAQSIRDDAQKVRQRFTPSQHTKDTVSTVKREIGEIASEEKERLKRNLTPSEKTVWIARDMVSNIKDDAQKVKNEYNRQKWILSDVKKSTKEDIQKVKAEYNRQKWILSDMKKSIKEDAQRGQHFLSQKATILKESAKQLKPNERVVAGVIASAKVAAERNRQQSVTQDVGWVGNTFIQGMTGIRSGQKNPYANVGIGVRQAVAKAHGKKIKMGRKLSKKEIKTLQKKYGKNWRMAVGQDSQGYMSQVSPRERTQIMRRNKMETMKVDFGGVFPEPTMPLNSETATVPFGNRIDEPTDVEANFMGVRGSGFADKRHDMYDVGSGFGGGLKDVGSNNLFGGDILTKKKQNPFEAGIKL